MKKQYKKKDIAKMITDKIIEQLKNGVAPWTKNYTVPFPKNYITNNNYNGVNTFMLLYEAQEKNYASSYWLTFNQIRTLDKKLIKDSKGVPVVYYKMFTPKEDLKLPKNEQRKIPMLRYSTVFNASCVDGLEIDAKKENETILTGQEILNAYKNKPVINHAPCTPSYAPGLDIIQLPSINNFKTSDHYYKTLFHELAHSTGHKSRMNRTLDSVSTSKVNYSKEELIAELTSMFLSTKAGLKVDTANTTAYCQSWLKALENDPKMIITASSKAQKVYNYILDQDSIK